MIRVKIFCNTIAFFILIIIRQWENGLKQGKFQVTSKDGTINKYTYNNGDLVTTNE